MASYVPVLLGGCQIPHEQMLLEKESARTAGGADQRGGSATEAYTIADESNGFTVQAGTGLDLKLLTLTVLVFRVASVESSRSYVSPNRGLNR